MGLLYWNDTSQGRGERGVSTPLGGVVGNFVAMKEKGPKKAAPEPRSDADKVAFFSVASKLDIHPSVVADSPHTPTPRWSTQKIDSVVILEVYLPRGQEGWVSSPRKLVCNISSNIIEPQKISPGFVIGAGKSALFPGRDRPPSGAPIHVAGSPSNPPHPTDPSRPDDPRGKKPPKQAQIEILDEVVFRFPSIRRSRHIPLLPPYPLLFLSLLLLLTIVCVVILYVEVYVIIIH